MKEYTLHFFRAPFNDEIGPQGELLVFACRGAADALKTGRQEAIKRDWRFLGIY